MIRERNTVTYRARQGFTLIELLTVIAILAILAAILFPVFARAKTSAKTAATSSNLRQIGMAANLYINDYDDGTVLTSWGDNDRANLWTLSLQPYLKSRTVFFDPSRSVHDSDKITLSNGIEMNWFEVPSLSINDAGYSGWWSTTNGGCTGKRNETQIFGTYHYGRTYASMNEPSQRIAFAPSIYLGNDVGFYFIRSYASSWPYADSSTDFTRFFPNEVYDTRTLYAGETIPVVHADGSVGKLRRKDFKTKDEAPDLVSYCQWMSTEGQRTWGPYWSAD